MPTSSHGPTVIQDESGAVSFASPAGVARRPVAEAAPRRADLAGATVVLFDNRRATGSAGGSPPAVKWEETAEYGAVLDWIAEELRGLPAPANVVRLGTDLLLVSADGIHEVAAQIRDHRPAGVVIAICHAGVTAPSSLLAGELERSGVPCVLVCTPLGGPLAQFMAEHDVPSLPVVTLASVYGRSAEAVAGLRGVEVAEVLAGLTGTPARTPEPRARAGGRRIVVDGNGLDVPALRRAAETNRDLWERYLGLGLSDGLPIVTPTSEGFAEMLAATGRDVDEVILPEPTPNHAPVTIGAAALNALLAGCRPEYMPIVVAAVEAMAKDEFRFFQAAITTHPGGVAIAVSGPVAERVGLASGAGCLGPGFRANATIGRAVNMIVMNAAGSRPGESSLATFGSPAQYSYCFAERADQNPWPLAHAEWYGESTSCVTVLKCESPHNVISNLGRGAEALLLSAASVIATLGSNAASYPGDHLVLVNPSEAGMLAREGLTKRDVQNFLFDHALLGPPHHTADRDSAAFQKARGLAGRRVVADPSEFRVFVAGGMGRQIMVAPPWGLSRAVTVPIDEST